MLKKQQVKTLEASFTFRLEFQTIKAEVMLAKTGSKQDTKVIET